MLAILSCLVSCLFFNSIVHASLFDLPSEEALADILNRGAPILGYDEGCLKSSKSCDWMANIPDDIKLVHMNLPGTHDTATWNYSDATQESLLPYTGPIRPASVFRCQENSIFQSLNEGIRVFDLRYAYNPGNTTIGFYHAQALLAPTTTLEDVLFGFYSWLYKHPTEAVFISLNHESGTGTPNDIALQTHLYNIFQSNLAKEYWVQTSGTLDTLAQARGKITLLQRFTYDLLPPTTHLIGIALPGSQWTDNSPDISITYNPTTDPPQIAYIEDYYETSDLPLDAGTQPNIQAKFQALTGHLENASVGSGGSAGQLYISFASAEHNDAVPTVSPRTMALGDGTDVLGINQQLLPWLQARKGQRFGIIMLDFYNGVPGLVEAVIGL